MKTPKQGDLLWQRCLPGGICMFIQSISGDMSDLPGNDWDSFEPDIFEVLHPTLGRIEEPEYYFETLASAIEEECI